MPPIDRYQNQPAASFGPAGVIFPVVPSDAADMAYVTTGLYVGVGGDVAMLDRSTGATVIFKSVAAGALLPVRVARIRATGTTASALVGLA